MTTMTKIKAEKLGWKIGRVMNGGFFAKKYARTITANCIKDLLSKLN